MVWVLGLTSRSDLLALFFIFGVLNLTNLDEKGGILRPPPYCAEFQIYKKVGFRLRAARVTSYQRRPTFVGDFTNVFKKMNIFYLKVLHYCYI